MFFRDFWWPHQGFSNLQYIISPLGFPNPPGKPAPLVMVLGGVPPKAVST